MIYYIIFISLFILGLYEMFFKQNKKTKKIIVLLTFVFMVFFAGLRWYVGTDFINYLRLYNLVNNESFKSVEITYRIASLFFKSFRQLLLFYAFLAIGTKFILINKNKYTFFTILLYYSFMYLSYDMGRMRQGAAIGFIFLALYYLMKNRNLCFILFVAIATLFHTTAIVFLFSLIVKKINFSKKSYIFIIIIVLVLSLIHFDYYIIQYISKTNIPIISKYATYFIQGFELYNYSFNPMQYRRIILVILFMFLSKDVTSNLNFKLFFTGTVIFYMFRDYGVIAERVSYYFTFVELFLIPSMLEKKSNSVKFVIYIVFSVYALYYMRTILSLNVQDYFNCPYVPYRF